MRKTAQVSIVTPIYNRENYIIETIESVLNQTVSDWELFLIDDGSTDNTKQVIEPYLSDERINYVYQPNQGQSVARNKGVNSANGEFVAFLDSDDRWLPNFLEVSLDAIHNNPKVGVSHADIILIDENGQELLKEVSNKYSGNVTKLMLRDNFVCFSTTLVRIEHLKEIGGFDVSVRLAADYDILLRLSTVCEFIYIPKYLTEYRVMENQISSDTSGRFNYNKKIIQTFYNKNRALFTWYEWRRVFSEFYHKKARYELEQGNKIQVMINMLLCAKFDPFWQGPWRVAIKLLISAIK